MYRQRAQVLWEINKRHSNQGTKIAKCYFSNRNIKKLTISKVVDLKFLTFNYGKLLFSSSFFSLLFSISHTPTLLPLDWNQPNASLLHLANEPKFKPSRPFLLPRSLPSLLDQWFRSPNLFLHYYFISFVNQFYDIRDQNLKVLAINCLIFVDLV